MTFAVVSAGGLLCLLCGGFLLFQQIHGYHEYVDIDGHEALWIRAVATNGTAGWVPSSQLRAADAMIQPYLSGDRSTEGQVDPVLW